MLDSTVDSEMNIKYVWDFNLALSLGPYAWPGGYPCYFVCADGEALSFDAARANADLVRDAVIMQDHSGWNVIGFCVNWEDSDLRCSHTNLPIESAYGN
jgi:hypothetical protein